MGLDEFKTETEFDVGEVKTRKKIENVKFPEDVWERLLYFDPVWGTTIAHNVDEQSIKAIVQTMDEIIEEGISGEKTSDDKIDEVRNKREEIVDFHLREE